MSSPTDQQIGPSFPQPLTEGKKVEVKSRLEAYWRFHRLELFRRHVSMSWKLTDHILTLDEAPTELDPNGISALCNKVTMLYLALSGQRRNTCPLIVFGCMYRDWFLRYVNEPGIEFDRFFTNQIRITTSIPAQKRRL